MCIDAAFVEIVASTYCSWKPLSSGRDLEGLYTQPVYGQNKPEATTPSVKHKEAHTVKPQYQRNHGVVEHSVQDTDYVYTKTRSRSAEFTNVTPSSIHKCGPTGVLPFFSTLHCLSTPCMGEKKSLQNVGPR